LSMVGLLGLWLYIQSKTLGRRGFWEAYLSVEISRILLGACGFLNGALSGVPGTERVVAIAGFGGALLSIPLLIAIWRYVYRSPAIWQTAAPAT